MSPTVVCVLRSGGRYRPRDVYALREGVAEHLPRPHRFVCLTDLEVHGVEVVPLEHGWPGWWSKFEVVRPGLFDGPVLYMDLDTLPVGDLSDLVGYRGPLALLSDFYRPRRAQSGVMLFVPGELTESVWQWWTQDAEAAMQGRRYRGDGEWLHAHTRSCGPDRIQSLYPGQVVSLKAHARESCPEGARLVCAHGEPKFDNPDAGWAHEVWKDREIRLKREAHWVRALNEMVPIDGEAA